MGRLGLGRRPAGRSHAGNPPKSPMAAEGPQMGTDIDPCCACRAASLTLASASTGCERPLPTPSPLLQQLRRPKIAAMQAVALSSVASRPSLAGEAAMAGRRRACSSLQAPRAPSDGLPPPTLLAVAAKPAARRVQRVAVVARCVLGRGGEGVGRQPASQQPRCSRSSPTQPRCWSLSRPEVRGAPRPLHTGPSSQPSD